MGGMEANGGGMDRKMKGIKEGKIMKGEGEKNGQKRGGNSCLVKGFKNYDSVMRPERETDRQRDQWL